MTILLSLFAHLAGNLSCAEVQFKVCGTPKTSCHLAKNVNETPEVVTQLGY